MAAALFRRCLPDPDPEWPEATGVASAGLLPGGFASPAEVVTVMAEFDLDVSAHASTQVTPAIVAGADLVVAMGRRHAREVVLLDPGAWTRTFTAKEIVRRGERVGPRSAGEPLDRWLARLHQGRVRTALVGSSAEDDVADPLGGPLAAYRATARELAELVEGLAGLLWAGCQIQPSPG